METACNACCRRFFHVGRFLTDDLFPGFMMPSDPAARSSRSIRPLDPVARSRRPIRPLDPAARSSRSIPPSDPAARSGRLIRPSDPSRRSSRRSSRHFSFPCIPPCIPPCNTPGASPALLRRSALHLSCTFPMLHDGPRPGCRLFGTVRLFNSYDKLFEKGDGEKSDNLPPKRMTAKSPGKSNFALENDMPGCPYAPPVPFGRRSVCRRMCGPVVSRP